MPIRRVQLDFFGFFLYPGQAQHVGQRHARPGGGILEETRAGRGDLRRHFGHAAQLIQCQAEGLVDQAVTFNR